jgi:hypothetical protein
MEFIFYKRNIYQLFFAKSIYVRSMYNIWMEIKQMSFKKNMEVLKDIWDKSRGTMICPQCKGTLTLIQIEPIESADEAYTPYKTVIECTSCSFKLVTESFTILGSVKQFDSHQVEIGSWSPSGSRVTSKYEHIISYDLLKKLQKSGELVEFLIVNKQVVQVIG